MKVTEGNNFPFFPIKIFIYPVKIMTVMNVKMNGKMNGKKSYPKPEEVIVNDLIEALENGVSLWRKEWTLVKIEEI